jgi:hypothetical protein
MYLPVSRERPAADVDSGHRSDERSKQDSPEAVYNTSFVRHLRYDPCHEVKNSQL